MCEPEPSVESLLVAHSLINQAPLISRKADDPESRRKEARYVYRLSRALIGEELAKKLNYPDVPTFAIVGALKFQTRLHKFLDHVIPGHRAGDEPSKVHVPAPDLVVRGWSPQLQAARQSP